MGEKYYPQLRWVEQYGNGKWECKISQNGTEISKIVQHIHDDDRTVTPRTSGTDVNVARIKKPIFENRPVTFDIQRTVHRDVFL